MVSIIVASDPDGVIGSGNLIPWHLPDDLKLFKKRTLGSSIIMGRITWESLPKKPLLGRVNYVISKGDPQYTGHRSFQESLAGPIWCKSLEAAISDARKNKDESGNQQPIYIIGGEQIYNLALQLDVVDRIILSKLRQCYEGDRYFKVPGNWTVCEKELHKDFDVIHFVKKL